MFKKIFGSKKRNIITGAAVIVVALAAVGYFGFYKPRIAFAASTTTTQAMTLKTGVLTATIGANGSVRSQQNATVSWGTSGKIAQINAKLGQTVKAGDVIMSLDPNSTSETLIQAQADLLSAQTALDELKNPSALTIATAQDTLKKAKDALDALQNPTALQITQAQTALKTAQDALDALKNPSELDIANAKAAVVADQTAVDTAQKAMNIVIYGNTNGSESQIDAARADWLLAQGRIQPAQNRYDKTPGNPDTDARKASALSNLQAAINAAATAKAKLDYLMSKPTASDIATLKSNLAVAQSKLKDAQDTLDKLLNPTPEDLALAQAKVDDAQKTLDELTNPTAESIALAKAEVDDAQKALDKLYTPDSGDLATAQGRIDIAQATLNLVKVTAPFDGVITSLSALPGDMVSSGTTAFRIDDTSSYYVDLQVSEVDINKIQVGQPVTMTYDAIENKTYNGKVTLVGSVGTSSSGTVNFTVTVQMTDADTSVKPGMTAAANVVVQQVEGNLLVPNQAVRLLNSQHFVYVRQTDGSYKAVTVTVVASNDTQSAIQADGIKEGDIILSNVSTVSTTSIKSAGITGLGGIVDTGGGPANGTGGGPAGGQPPAGGN